MHYHPSDKERAQNIIAGGVMYMADGRELCVSDRAYIDRTQAMIARQEGRCAMCGHMMGQATFDHAEGRGMGGSHQDDKIVDADGKWLNAALCVGCQGLKGSRRFEWRDGVYGPVGNNFKEAVDEVTC